MYHNIKEDIVCSQCGTKNNIEHFSHTGGSGIRCRSCKHEKLDPKPTESTGQTYKHEDSITSF